jgi:hypothetical protein
MSSDTNREIVKLSTRRYPSFAVKYLVFLDWRTTIKYAQDNPGPAADAALRALATEMDSMIEHYQEVTGTG